MELGKTKCERCGKEVSHGYISMDGVFFCEECLPAERAKWQRHLEELLNEPIGVVPEKFKVKDFDRFAMKVSVHIIHSLPEEIRRDLRENKPILLDPTSFALTIKAKVLSHMPLYYVSMVDVEGGERMFYDGKYQFKADVPKEVVKDAYVKAGILDGKEF
jgi:hypothetical protein